MAGPRATEEEKEVKSSCLEVNRHRVDLQVMLLAAQPCVAGTGQARRRHPGSLRPLAAPGSPRQGGGKGGAWVTVSKREFTAGRDWGPGQRLGSGSVHKIEVNLLVSRGAPTARRRGAGPAAAASHELQAILRLHQAHPPPNVSMFPLFSLPSSPSF